MSKKLYILDTNILLSSLLSPRGIVRQAFDRAIINGFLVFSAPTYDELIEVIHRPKFNRYLTDEMKSRFLAKIAEVSLFVFEIPEKITECADPKDNQFLELAVAVQATCIITGDKKHLIPMNPFRGIPIITCEEFLRSSRF